MENANRCWFCGLDDNCIYITYKRCGGTWQGEYVCEECITSLKKDGAIINRSL